MTSFPFWGSCHEAGAYQGAGLLPPTWPSSMGSMRAPCQMGKPSLPDQLRPCSSREAKKSASPGFPLQLQIPQDGRGGDSGATDVGVLVEKDGSSKSVTMNWHLRGQAP